MGDHTWKVATNSPLAQRDFDQGLAFLYGFNYTEAARSFDAAAAADPNCAMAYWGIAIANGDGINDPVGDEPLARTAVEALERARELAPNARPVERDLIEALSTRYADPPPADPKPLDRAYAQAMRKVWKSYPDDGDVGASDGTGSHALTPERFVDARGRATARHGGSDPDSPNGHCQTPAAPVRAASPDPRRRGFAQSAIG